MLFRNPILALLLLASAPSLAQRRPPATVSVPAAPATAGSVYDPAGRWEGGVGGVPGRYQLADGTWHETVVYEVKTDRVYLGEAGKNTSAAVFPEQITRFTARGETYGAVSGFRARRGGRLVPPTFARQLFDAGGYTLFYYEKPDESFWTGLFSQHLLLRIGDEPLLVLPRRSRPFNQLMLTIVGDNPVLAKQLRANKFRPYSSDAADILTTYVLSKAAGK